MVHAETKGYEPKHEQEIGALCSAMELCQVHFLFAFAFVCLRFLFHVPCIHSRMHREWYDYFIAQYKKNGSGPREPGFACAYTWHV